MLAGEAYSASADVYSYGIVMWEMAAQQEPWPDVQGSFICDQLLALVRAGKRPPIEAGWPHAYVAEMECCWATNPVVRPSFAAMVM